MKALSFTTAFVLLTTFAGTVEAGPREVTVSARVAYGDLDLNTTGGAQALQWRVRNAARSLCLRTRPGLSLELPDRRCMNGAIAQARPQVEQAIARATNGDPAQMAVLVVER